MSDTLIQAKAESFIRDEILFTSVDVSNALKKDGNFVRNRDVTAWLHAHSDDAAIFPNYTATIIPVRNGAVQATLYYPCWKDPDDYQKRDQKALSPSDLNLPASPGAVNQTMSTMTAVAPAHTAPSASAVSSPATSRKSKPVKTPVVDIADAADDPKSDIAMSAIVRSKLRVWIPVEMVKKLGWKPGDKLDETKVLTDKPVPKSPGVDKRWRVSVPRNCINISGRPIKVILTKSGTIRFEKV